MARPRNPDRDKAKEIWLASGKKKLMKEIAAELGVPDSRLRKWKAEDKWERNETERSDTSKRSAPKPKKERSTNKSFDRKLLEELEEHDGITEQRRMFCYYKLCGFSDVGAYIEAYNCSYSNAQANAYRLMANDGVKQCIADLKGTVNTELGIPSAEEVFTRYAKLFYARHSDFIDYGTHEVDVGRGAETKNFIHFKDPSEVDEELISSISLGKDGVKVELDKAKALEFFAKHHNMNPMDKHKKDYDNARLEIEKQRVEQGNVPDDTTKGTLDSELDDMSVNDLQDLLGRIKDDARGDAGEQG